MTIREALIIGGMALGVFLPKMVPLLLVTDRLTPRVRRWLSYVAPAVLSALVAPAVLAPQGHLAGWASPWEVAGYAITFVVAVSTRRMFPAVVSGLVVVAAGALAGR